jgi:hypothetical protein
MLELSEGSPQCCRNHKLDILSTKQGVTCRITITGVFGASPTTEKERDDDEYDHRII